MEGLGVTASAGGDYDGDEVFITADRGLLDFMLAMEERTQALPISEESKKVKFAPTPDAKVLRGQDRAAQFREHAPTQHRFVTDSGAAHPKQRRGQRLGEHIAAGRIDPLSLQCA